MLIATEVIITVRGCIALLSKVDSTIILSVFASLALLAATQKLLFAHLVKLLLNLQLVLHDLLLCLQKKCLLSQVNLLPL